MFYCVYGQMSEKKIIVIINIINLNKSVCTIFKLKFFSSIFQLLLLILIH